MVNFSDWFDASLITISRPLLLSLVKINYRSGTELKAPIFNNGSKVNFEKSIGAAVIVVQ